MEIGKRIKLLRDSKGFTQEELGKLVGVSKATINRYETGEIDIKRTIAIKLGKALDVSPAIIMGWSDQTLQPEENIQNKIPILQKYNKLNDIGQEKADTYISDLLENPKYVAEAYQGECGYASIAADTGKSTRIPAPDFDTIIELNKDNQ